MNYKINNKVLIKSTGEVGYVIDYSPDCKQVRINVVEEMYIDEYTNIPHIKNKFITVSIDDITYIV